MRYTYVLTLWILSDACTFCLGLSGTPLYAVDVLSTCDPLHEGEVSWLDVLRLDHAHVVRHPRGHGVHQLEQERDAGHCSGVHASAMQQLRMQANDITHCALHTA